MTEAKIREAVLLSLRKIAPEIDPATIDPAANLREQVDLDSMDLMNFVIDVGERLEVEIPEQDYPMLLTLNRCVSYLSARLGVRSGS